MSALGEMSQSLKKTAYINEPLKSNLLFCNGRWWSITRQTFQNLIYHICSICINRLQWGSM